MYMCTYINHGDYDYDYDYDYDFMKCAINCE